MRGRAVRVTNPEKLTFPAAGIRKIDVINYYVAVGDGILRALYERPVTLERWQDGVHEGGIGRLSHANGLAKLGRCLIDLARAVLEEGF